MDKLLTFPTHNERGIFLFTIGEGRDQGFLTKTAAEYHPEIGSYINQAKPIPGKTQVLLTALGAGEAYGANINGDFFPEEALKHRGKDYGYKTFEYMAKVYKHHINKDPAKSYGDVLLSIWNEKMKRIELIVSLDHTKAPDLVERINNGEYPEVSMGTRVPFDICSCCGNQAKTRAQYCDHLRYYMNKIPPGYSKKAAAINTMPKFFDISFVLIGADRIASVMKKVASIHPEYGMSSALLMEKVAYGLDRQKIAAKKVAAIKKEIPSNLDGNTIRTLEDLGSQGSSVLRPLEPTIPKKVIIQITIGKPGPDLVNKVLSTIGHLGILPKPQEFQSIVLRSLGKSDLADDFERKRIVFDRNERVSSNSQCLCDKMIRLGPDKFDETIFRQLAPFLEDRSYSRPLLHRRVMKLEKLAQNGNFELNVSEDKGFSLGKMPVMITLAGLYLAFGKKLPEANMSGLEKLFQKHPGVAAALMVGAISSFDALTARSVKGKFDFNPDFGPHKSESWQDQISRRNANPLLKTSGLAKSAGLLSNPAAQALGGSGALYMLSGIKEVGRMRRPNEEEGLVSSYFRKYPGEASLLLGGNIIAGNPIGKRLASGAKDLFGLLTKRAEISDQLKSTAIYSMAFPGHSFPIALTSMAIDYGIMGAIGDLFTRKNNKGGSNAYN